MNIKKNAAFFLVFMVAISTSPALSQAESRSAVDMMLVIDNSCSMFPRNQILPGCTAFGSDPELLRIIGADLFIARLGFAETNEGNYNLGVVGLGDEPQLLFPLQNLVGARDLAAKSIANPAPQLATKLIPALEMAYKELTTSVNSQVSNMKAVVLLTDGVPYPKENQANADIERLIDSYPDIPLFIMLLQSSDKDLEAYNLFWEEMQSTRTNVYVSKVTDSTQIEQAYNSIVAKIQNTVPADGRVVSPNQPYKFFVSEDVQRIIITTVHPLGDSQSQVTVLDPEGKSISENEPGVTRFRGIDNPVEVISIFQPRLSDNLKNQTWVITSNAEVNVFLDRQGAYRVQFLAPDVSITDFSDSYIAIDSFSPAQDFEIKFNLLYSTGNVKTKPEKIVVKLVLPDGTQSILSNANLLQPDSNGVYTINFNPMNEYPDIENQTGKFIVTVDAGSADDQSLVTIPVSAAKILINFSPGPYIVSLNPPTLTCKNGQSAQFEVVLADADLAIPDSINVRVFNSEGEIDLVPNPIALDTYTGDLTELCKSQLEIINCSTRLDLGFKIRLSSQLISTSEQVSTNRILPVTIIGQDCLPLPLSTATPLPNCDGDALNDNNDLCKCQSGWSQFQGCPPPVWFVGLMLFFALGLIAFIVWLIPSIRVLISPPPQAFVLACTFGEHFPAIKSSYKIGMERRVSRVKIGGDPRMSEIYVKDLQPVEFVIIKMDNNIQVHTYDQKTKRTALRLIVSDIAATIPTSIPGVSLKFSLKKENLRC